MIAVVLSTILAGGGCSSVPDTYKIFDAIHRQRGRQSKTNPLPTALVEYFPSTGINIGDEGSYNDISERCFAAGQFGSIHPFKSPENAQYVAKIILEESPQTIQGEWNTSVLFSNVGIGQRTFPLGLTPPFAISAPVYAFNNYIRKKGKRRVGAAGAIVMHRMDNDGKGVMKEVTNAGGAPLLAPWGQPVHPWRTDMERQVHECMSLMAEAQGVAGFDLKPENLLVFTGRQWNGGAPIYFMADWDSYYIKGYWQPLQRDSPQHNALVLLMCMMASLTFSGEARIRTAGFYDHPADEQTATGRPVSGVVNIGGVSRSTKAYPVQPGDWFMEYIQARIAVIPGMQATAVARDSAAMAQLLEDYLMSDPALKQAASMLYEVAAERDPESYYPEWGHEGRAAVPPGASPEQEESIAESMTRKILFKSFIEAVWRRAGAEPPPTALVASAADLDAERVQIRRARAQEPPTAKRYFLRSHRARSEQEAHNLREAVSAEMDHPSTAEDAV